MTNLNILSRFYTRTLSVSMTENSIVARLQCERCYKIHDYNGKEIKGKLYSTRASEDDLLCE